MGTAPTVTNTLASGVSRTVGDVFNAAVPIAEAAIIAAAPFMATPGFEQIWEEIFKLAVGELGKAMGVELAFLVMDAQVYSEVTGAASSISALQAAQATGDANAIAQARAAADAAAANLLHFDGDAHS